MTTRICRKCGKSGPEVGAAGKKYICPLCDGWMKVTDLRAQEISVERYLAAKWKESVR